MHKQIPSAVFEAYGHLGRIDSIEVINMGLINKTYVMTADRQKYILQEVSPIFDVSIHYDSQAVCQRLQANGLKAPLIIPTNQQALYFQGEGRVFRVLCHIPGHSYHAVQSLKMAHAAGLMLGRFHKALLDFNYEYQSKRRHAGDYRFHMENLQKALSAHPEHEYYSLTAPLAHQMLKDMTALIANLSTTPRNVHGDPKISNIIFDEHDQAICLVDFDTLGRSGWSLEVADALRSWCNPHQEDELSSHVDFSIAEAALSGYGQTMKGLISAKEIEELVVHSQCITLCLAMRYLYDVLNECYWAYDQSRFKRASEHNWLRAQAMYNLFQDFAQQNAKMRELAHCMLSL